MRERKEPEPDGCPFWVVTFGDTMSLLVTFFVMLVSFADFEEHSLQNMMGALKGGLRAVPLPMATTVGRVDSPLNVTASKDVVASDASVSEAVSSQEVLREQPARNVVKTNSPDYYLHLIKNGISITIRQSTAFKPGLAEIAEPNHEAWQVAVDLMYSISSEIRIEVTLPETVTVRLRDYTTPWGLGIEQAIAVQDLLAMKNGGERRSMSTSVRVVRSMPRDQDSSGSVEICFIGEGELSMSDMPARILRGVWRQQDPVKKGRDDG